MVYGPDRQLLEEDRHVLIPHGSPGLKRTGGYIDEEFLTKLKGKRGMRVFREMADNDPVIGTALWIIESLCRQVEWETEENDSGHQLAAYGAEFGEQLFGDMETTWRAKIGELLSMLIYGHVIIEPEMKIRRGDSDDALLYSRHSDGMYGWREWGLRPQETIERWVFDDTGRLVGAIQIDPSTGETNPLPVDRMLLFRVRARNNNPEGYSLLRPAYTSYYFANRLRDIEAIGIERNIAGMPDYQLPPECFGPNATPDQQAMLEAAREFVMKIRLDKYYGAVRPSELDREGQPTGFKFGLLSSSGKSFADTSPIITRHETRAAQVFMAEFMMTGTGSSSSGSYSLHSDKTALMAMAVGAILDIIDDISNSIALPRIWKLNGLPAETVPTRKHGDVEKQQILDTFNAVSGAISAGAMYGDDDVDAFLRKLVSMKPREGEALGSVLQQAVSEHKAIGDVSGEVPNGPPDPEQDAMPYVEEEPPPNMWTVEEAAAEMRVSPSVIRSAIRRKQLPGVPIGRTFRVPRAKVEAMFDHETLG